jgi:hypothetical protein
MGIESRFGSLRYPVHAVTGSLQEAFPDLFRYDEFKKLLMDKHGDKLVRYIVLLYDYNSDLIFEYQTNLKERKDAAAIEVGFTRSPDNTWPKYLQKIMDMGDKLVVECILRYLKMQKNDVWVDIVTTEQELDEFQRMRMTPIKDLEDTKQKDILMKACDVRVKHLKNRYTEFFGLNKDLQAAEFEEMITPENALRILGSKPPWEEVDEQEPVEQTAETSSV